MENLEFHPLQGVIMGPEQTMAAHLKLAEQDGTERESLARLLALDNMIDDGTSARWSVPARQPVVTRSTVGAPTAMPRRKVA